MTHLVMVKKSNVALCALFLFSLSNCSDQVAMDQAGAGKSYQPVKYIPYLTSSQQANGVLVKYRDNLNADTKARSLRSAGLVNRQQNEVLNNLVLANTVDGISINETLDNLSSDPNVVYAEPNYILTTNATLPDDTDFSMQLALNNPDNIDIDAPEAWDMTTGSKNVVIAVIDSGIDYTHPDLKNQLWKNIGEIPDNQIDDDNNGYVDDVMGWNFVSNDNDPMDDNDHGTRVSGIIGAEGNNSVGIAGINWQVQIMPLKFIDSQGVGTIAGAIEAIQYALINGAKISNNSWGGGGFSQSLFDAIQMANEQGHLFVSTAGNDASNNDKTPTYPGSYNLPNIISVTALDNQDNLANFANFGLKSVDIAAPGVEIYSTVRNNQYSSVSGSSMATALVTGTIGLMMAQSSQLTGQELKDILLASVIPLPNLTNNVKSGGKLNVYNAIKKSKLPVK